MSLPHSPDARRQQTDHPGVAADRPQRPPLFPKESLKVLTEPQVALFLGTAPVFLDSHSTVETRAGEQQCFMIVTTGLGALVGNLSAGRVFDAVAASGGGPAAFRTYWSIPATAAFAAALLMLLLFKETRPEPRSLQL
jgi:hypothetical protein